MSPNPTQLAQDLRDYYTADETHFHIDHPICTQAAATIETMHGLLLWALYHHQGGSSRVGQPIRKALGIAPHADLSTEQLALMNAAVDANL